VPESACKTKTKVTLESPCYTGVTSAMNVLSLIQLLAAQIILAKNATGRPLNLWGSYAFLINTFFLVDLILFFVYFGGRYVVDHKKVLLMEIILQIFAIYAECLFFSDGIDTENGFKKTYYAIDLFNIVSLFRMLRMLYLLGEVRQFNTIF
jgi:hypothetical protein